MIILKDNNIITFSLRFIKFKRIKIKYPPIKKYNLKGKNYFLMYGNASVKKYNPSKPKK